MKKRELPALGSAALTILGLIIALVWSPVAGVVVATLGFGGTLFGIMLFNTPTARAGLYLAGAAHGVAVFQATSSLPLALAASSTLFLAPMTALLLRSPAFGAVGMPLVAFGIVGLCLVLAWPTGWWALAFLPHALLGALFGVGGVFGLDELSDKAIEGTTLKLGEPMPAMTLPVRGGGQFDLASERGQPIILCYLRGDWCPICHVFMRLFRKEAKRLAEMGVKLVAVSPSQGEDAIDFAEQMEMDYVMLIDEDAKTAKAWGLLSKDQYKGGDVPLPVALLIDAGGKLQFITNPHDMSPVEDQNRILSLLTEKAA